MFNRIVLVGLLIIVKFICSSKAYKYTTVLQNDEIFSKCENQPDSVLDVHGFWDMSDLSLKPDFYKVTVSGNATFIWDIKPTDRIEVISNC